jgi:hypothetical protein
LFEVKKNGGTGCVVFPRKRTYVFFDSKVATGELVPTIGEMESEDARGGPCWGDWTIFGNFGEARATGGS